MAKVKPVMLLSIVGLLLSLAGCRQKNVDLQLPPETMTGQRTLGCLVNGKVWIPGGKPLLFRSSLTMSYEPSYYNGTLAIRANINNYEKSISFTKTGVGQLGIYQFVGDTTSGVIYRDESLPSPCVDFSTNRSYPERKITQGQLTITRLDLTSRVIAGRFSFTLAQPGCDTIRITDGRFDMPLQ